MQKKSRVPQIPSRGSVTDEINEKTVNEQARQIKRNREVAVRVVVAATIVPQET